MHRDINILKIIAMRDRFVSKWSEVLYLSLTTFRQPSIFIYT